MSVNKAIIVGRLGQDPELRQTGGGTTVANFSVATSRKYDGEEHTEWHRIVVFGRQAEVCGQYLEKGRQVYVEGRLQTNEWEDRDGNARKTTEIVASNVNFLSGGGQGGGRKSGGRPDRGNSPGGGWGSQPEGSSPDSDDIPF